MQDWLVMGCWCLIDLLGILQASPGGIYQILHTRVSQSRSGGTDIGLWIDECVAVSGEDTINNICRCKLANQRKRLRRGPVHQRGGRDHSARPPQQQPFVLHVRTLAASGPQYPSCQTQPNSHADYYVSLTLDSLPSPVRLEDLQVETSRNLGHGHDNNMQHFKPLMQQTTKTSSSPYEWHGHKLHPPYFWSACLP